MDTIYYGGPIITMENKSDDPEAVLVKDGIFAKVGKLEDAKKTSPNAKMVDLEGKCLMPSFIDPTAI